ncbi:MAG: winged helix-turn-helix domain-containing protein [Pseudomonadota bacterium]
MHIGDWELHPQRNLLRRSDREVRLEPRHADLLIFLAGHRGEVVSAEQILDTVWQGQVVTDQSVYQAIAKLRRAFGDDAAKPRYIETVSKRGYRLIAEVSGDAGQLDPASATDTESSSAGSHATTRSFKGYALAAAAMLAVAWIALRFFPQAANTPVSNVVAVVPFTVLSSDPDDQLLAAGFAIELAHLLGRTGHVRVIGPVSSALAARLDMDTTVIGEHLGASVVINGSLRRSEAGIRVTSAVTEVPSGYQLWSEVLDRDDQQILKAQRDMAIAITGALEEYLQKDTDVAISSGNAVPETDRVAYDNYLLGRYYRHLRNEGDLLRARQYYQNSLAVDPDFVPALREMAATELLLFFYGTEPLTQAITTAEANLKRAMQLAPESPEGLALIGLSHYLQGKYLLAEDALQRAVTAQPNLQEAWMWLGLTQQQQGRLTESLAAFEYGSELEPLLVTAVVDYAEALVWSGRKDLALSRLRNLADKANDSMDNRDQLFRTLSLVHRKTGELGAAYEWSERALEVAPDSKLSLANKVVLLTLFGEEDQARQLAKKLYYAAQPGRGTMQFLGRANIIEPGILDHALLSAHLEELQQQPDTPEIEWRLSNLDVGMWAYHQNDLARSIELLERALRGRDFPIAKADDDLYACASLADAQARSGSAGAAATQLASCREDLSAAEQQGWNSLSLMISRIRLAILQGDEAAARSQLSLLFAVGLRNEPILVNDPILDAVRETAEYNRLVKEIRESVELAKQSTGPF